MLRRPDYAPPLCVALVMLMADLMFQRPPGLQAVLVLLGSEYLKYRTNGLSDASFVGEWTAVCIVVIGIILIDRLVLAILLVPAPTLGISLIQMVLTMLTYPLVVLVSQLLLGVRRLAPSDAVAMGGRA